MDVYDRSDSPLDDDSFACHVFDFDHDGKSDVVIHKAISAHLIYFNTKTYWMRSTGSKLDIVSSVTTNDPGFSSPSKFLVTGDFNGDGKIELMNYGNDIYNGTDYSTRKWCFYRDPNVIAGSGMLSSVTSGYGLKDSISYAPLTKSSIYTNGNGSTYPVIDITIPMSAVQSVIYDNGVAGTVREDYKYSGAKVHLQGKGFLGFQSMTIHNNTTGVTTESGYTTLHSTWLAPSETYSKTILDGDTATTTVNYTFVDKLNNKFFAYHNKKTNIDLYNNTDSTTYHYDTTYGYIKDEKTVYGSSNMYKKVLYESYIKAGGRYQPQLVTSIGKHSDDSQTFTQKTAFTFEPTKGYLLKKVENSGTTLALTTEISVNGYDTFGNLKEYKVSGYGVPLITYKTEYDPTNRFISKKYSAPSSTTVSFLYDTWGNVTSETDETNPANPLTTVHTYNSWGQKTSTTLIDSTKTTYYTGWGEEDVKKKYFTLTQGKGQPWIKTWYDANGRETASESIGPKGMKIASTKFFNDKGQLVKTEDQQGNLWPVVNYEYDARGRIKKQHIVDGQLTEYTYGNREVSVTTNSHTSTKTFDAWGGINKVEDPLSGIVTFTYKSVGKPWTIDANGAISTMDYDSVGNQKLLTDPNAGTINYTYDAAGRVKIQTDSKGNQLSVIYDAQGRMTTSTMTTSTQETIPTIYTYGTTGFDINRLTKVETGVNSTSYTYDKFGRTLTEKRLIEGTEQVNFVFGYSSSGQLETTTYPGGVQVTREYDAYGNQVKVLGGGQMVWELTGAIGTTTTTRLGGTMTSTSIVDGQGLLTSLKTVMGSTVLRDMNFQFNASTGNLTWRTGVNSQKETFEYDDLDRLKNTKTGEAEVVTMAIAYHPNGNISSKTSIGSYGYHPTKLHAVNSVDNYEGLIPAIGQSISYNSFNKADCLKDTIGTNDYQLDIVYGPDQQRWKSVLKSNGTAKKTIIFAGEYEKFIDNENGITRELYYIGADDGLAAVYVKTNGQGIMYYVHTDHLGSIVSLTDSAGVAVFKASYDAWGKQTVTLNTINFYRGYTGHEHLPEFGLINMNGRMYDPEVGRFLSPDNYVQAGDFSQSYNRYSYCLNNPLKYTDPTGEYALIDDLIVMAVGGVINLGVNAIQGNIHSWGEAGGYFLSGAAAAELTIYTGPVAGGALLGSGNDITTQLGQKSRGEIEKIDWGQTTISGFMGGMTASVGGKISGFVSPLISGLTSKIASPVIQQAVMQSITNAVSGFSLATGVSLLNGNDLQTALGEGGKGALFGAGLGLTTGAIAGYKYAQEHNLNWRNGKSLDVPTPYTVTPDGVILPKGAYIPDDLIENPYGRQGSYGRMVDGKFYEIIRIDPQTAPGYKGPNTSHFHLDGGKKHIFDINKWPWWKN